GRVVDRDGAAHGDPAVGPERGDGGLQVVGADVVEVDVDAVRGRLLEQIAHGSPPVVERGVEAELPGHVGDLLVGSDAADDPGGALEPGELPGQAAHRAGGGRDEDHVAFLHPGDVEQPDVRGEARHA